MKILLTIIAVVSLVVLGMAVCIVSERIEQRRGLKRLRKRLALADIPDEQFAASFTELAPGDALEMRRMLAAMLGIDPLKIRPEWRFREELDLKNLEPGILHLFAGRYAPETFNKQVFEFPKGGTVRDLFVQASRLQSGGSWEIDKPRGVP